MIDVGGPLPSAKDAFLLLRLLFHLASEREIGYPGWDMSAPARGCAGRALTMIPHLFSLCWEAWDGRLAMRDGTFISHL